MAPLFRALRALGANIVDQGRGTLPFVVRGAGFVSGGEVVLDASASSQFVSALLLVGARFDEGLTVVHHGPPVPSLPHIAMTVSMLRAAGVDVDDSVPDQWSVEPGPIAARSVDVEPDLSNAAPFLAAAMVTAGRVRIPGWPLVTTQAGDALRGLFTQMGAAITLDAQGLELRGPDRLQPLDVDLHDVGELTPVLAAVAALASGPSRLRGIGHLRGHETDRLAALAAEIGALGGDVDDAGDQLVVRPRRLHAGVWHTYADHRMAQAGAVLGLRVPGVQIEDIGTTAKTMPEFAGRWTALVRGASGPAPVRRDDGRDGPGRGTR